MSNSLIGKIAIVASAALLLASCCGKNDGVIRTKVPARPAGQEDVIGLKADPIDTVRIGIVGLGARGSFAVYRYTNVPWSKIVALCDVLPEKVEKSANYLVENGFSRPDGYTGLEGYKELCERDDIDLVYICTDWVHHTPIALYAMEHGKHVAIEVPAATTLEECWALVNTAEKTRRHCMMLENCCYDFFELSALQMAREGLFGEILHAEGSYCHNLFDYWNDYWENWRLDFNYRNRGDVYPTHGLGPIAQALNIHRGDRFKTLVAVDTKSANGQVAFEKKKAEGKYFQGEDAKDFRNGDITCTLIRTENGKSVLVEHDVLNPRPYNRMYQLVGTLGYAAKYPVEQLSLRPEQLEKAGIDYKIENQHAALPEDVVNALREKYPTPILDAELEEKAKRVGGHGGMDFLMDYRLIYCLHYGLPLDMDVYDLAEWCCLGELGSISMDNGCAPVEVPDFTRGGWQKTDGFKYAFADGSMR